VNVVYSEVDELGRLRAQIADLRTREEELVAGIKLRGDGVYEGTMFRAVVSAYDRCSTDWKAIAEHLEASRQLIKAHTTNAPQLKLTMAAK
jgi:hypothetical protein